MCSTTLWLSEPSEKSRQFLFCCLLLLFSSNAISENWGNEKAENCAINENTTNHTLPPQFETAKQTQTNISADTTRSYKTGDTELSGHVVIEQHGLRITSDKATYNQTSNDVGVSGNVHADTKTMSFDADKGVLSKDKQSATFNEVEFYVPENGMRGTASSVLASDDKKTLLQNTSITSCDPRDPSWRLDADDIKLDHKDQYGSAEDVVLRFQEVPFLYLPYMEFPIGKQRRSGILAPEIRQSSSRGTEIAVPWYWNIAPDQDATLTPRYMRKRGTEMGAQYRYLTQSTAGQIDGAFLPDDDITGTNRYRLEYKQRTNFSQKLNMKIGVQDVSDQRYLDDFGNNLSTSSVTHLKSDIKLNYDTEYWNARALAQTIETLDTDILPQNKPYRRLPQFTLNGEQPVNKAGLSFTLDSEWVDFGHEDDTVDTGSRFTVRPGLRWLASGSYWYVDPAIKFSHTQYDVEDSSGVKQNLDDRNVSMSSLDTGLFFERDLESGLTQTLEPRIYYLNVPFRDQSVLPNFDTSLPTFSIAQLFRDNRFNGGDLIGDANQVTLALSSRLLNPSTGSEYLRASLGQIIYFEDRKVNLVPGTIEDSSGSDLIGELSGNWNDWSLSTSIQWDTKTHSSERDNVLLHYQSDQQHIFNLGLRTDDTLIGNEIRQTDVSFIAPISKDYSAFGRWNYSLKDNRDIEVIAGISYDSCCWSMQLLGQRRLGTSTASTEEYENSFMVQLVFKGIGSVSGKTLSNTLEHAILGYDEDY